MLQEAIESPLQLSKAYEELYLEQFDYANGHIQHYNKVREDFNNGNETSANMLYLLARCVKGAVRYGKNGKFNQSPDKRRHGTMPKKMTRTLTEVSNLLKGKCIFCSHDFRDVLNIAKQGDLVYLDPP
jgi:DNA adenine methylase